ncbi:MAG: hypothetical protein K0S19_1925 [Geminicoccaceae bacterium]|jgi:hypothetical protein|nr:hypothetical protein [Geminicoccaceae bacterium]
MNGTRLFNLATVPVTRYRYRGNTIPHSGPCPTTPSRQEPWSAGAVRVARRVRRAAFGETDRAQIPTPRLRPTQPGNAVVLCVDDMSRAPRDH